MSRARPAALLATAALLLFLATALWTQFVRTDLDWVRATLSLYLHGPWGLALRAAYCVLAVAIALLGIALYRDSIGPRRSAAAPLLFTVSALGLATVAIGDSWLPDATPLLAPFIHGLAANTAFLCASVGMLLQAWYLRREPGWQSAGRPALGLGLAGLRAVVAARTVARRSAPWAGAEGRDRGDRGLAAVPGAGPVPSQPAHRCLLKPPTACTGTCRARGGSVSCAHSIGDAT